MKVKGDRVLVEVTGKTEKITDGGLIIPETANDENTDVFIVTLKQVGDGVDDACYMTGRDIDDYMVGEQYYVEAVQFDDDVIGEEMILDSDRLIAMVEEY